MEETATCVRLLQEQGFDVRMVDDDEFAHGLTGDENVLEVLRGASAVIASGNGTRLGCWKIFPLFVWSPVLV